MSNIKCHRCGSINVTRTAVARTESNKPIVWIGVGIFVVMLIVAFSSTSALGAILSMPLIWIPLLLASSFVAKVIHDFINPKTSGVVATCNKCHTTWNVKIGDVANATPPNQQRQRT